MRALTPLQPQPQPRHQPRRNNEALAREGIDTYIDSVSTGTDIFGNNEALAREGIDTCNPISGM